MGRFAGCCLLSLSICFMVHLRSNISAGVLFWATTTVVTSIINAMMNRTFLFMANKFKNYYFTSS